MAAKRTLWAGILILAALLFAIQTNRKVSMQDGSKKIAVALQGEIPQGPLSPENISTIALYHLHYNIWETLLSQNQGAAVAKSFRVSQDNLTIHFEIDPEAKFSNGRAIMAEDVKAAFDRVIAREENGHINAKSVIRAITALSPRELKIELTAPTPSFLFLLTTPEFGIVPKEALDEAGNVANLSVTSGAYSVASVDAKAQSVHLVRNKFFRRAEEQAPEEIHVSFVRDLGVSSDLSGYDFTEVRSSDAEAIVASAEKRGLSHKSTTPSVSVFLVANTDLLTQDQAKFIAQAFREHFHYETSGGLEKRSLQFFPEKTFGSLSSQEIPAISAIKTPPKLPAEIVISNNRSTGPLVEVVLGVFHKIGVKVRIVSLDSKEPVHYMFTSQGMNTEFPEIELHLDTVGTYADFNATDEIKRLVSEATHEADDSKRAEIIKRVGKDFLSTGKIVPLTVRAYVHLFNPARLDLNSVTTYDGDIPFYKLRVRE